MYRASLAFIEGYLLCKKKPSVLIFSSPSAERIRHFASLSNTTTYCGWAHHYSECRSPLYAPHARVLFTFLKMSFREEYSSGQLVSINRVRDKEMGPPDFEADEAPAPDMQRAVFAYYGHAI